MGTEWHHLPAHPVEKMTLLTAWQTADLQVLCSIKVRLSVADGALPMMSDRF
jgi:hypothetical protein